jgi:hypothetical protein
MMEHTISMKDFFKDEGVKDDATKVTWAHAVNSKEELELALSSEFFFCFKIYYKYCFLCNFMTIVVVF